MTSLDKASKCLHTKEVLFLLYGNAAPAVSERNKTLLTQAFVARLTKLSLSKVNYLVNDYFNSFKPKPRESIFVPKYRSKPKGRSIVTSANLTPEEAEFMCCQENLQRWACVPLLGRCILFHRQFQER